MPAIAAAAMELPRVANSEALYPMVGNAIRLAAESPHQPSQSAIHFGAD